MGKEYTAKRKNDAEKRKQNRQRRREQQQQQKKQQQQHGGPDIPGESFPQTTEGTLLSPII